MSADLFESLSLDHKPHLRWRLHYQRGKPAARLRRRFRGVRWMDAAEDIPPEVTGDPSLLKSWISHRGQAQDPPYFAGSVWTKSNHDPLGVLLGWATAFPSGSPTRGRMRLPTPAQAAAEARHGWDGNDQRPSSTGQLPAEHQPIIVWGDPKGRADLDFPLHSPWRDPRECGTLARTSST